MTDSAPAAKWLELDRSRRRRVARAVRRGRAVDDPRDAPYAVGFADATLEWLSWRTRFRPLHLLLVVLLLAELGFTWSWRPAGLLYPLLVFGAMRLRTPARRRTISAARKLNAVLAAQLGLPPVTIRMPGRALFRPQSGLRRWCVVSLTLVLAGMVALAATAAISASRRAHQWAAAADRICAREQAEVAALPAGLGRYESRRRANVAEERALTSLERLAPEAKRTRLQAQFLAWRRYKLELDLWLLDGLGRDDRSVLAGYEPRARSAREHYRRFATGLGAKTCARA
jgi:hypothetical protein